MLRFILRRLAIIPVALFLVNFFGYAYAYLVLPIRAARIPYLASLPDPGPLLPAYTEYLQNAVRLDFGAPPGIEETLGELIVNAARASSGLLVLALALSLVIGLILGIQAVKVAPRRIARWLTFLSSAGMAMPSFYIGSLLTLAVFYHLLRTKGELLVPLSGFGWDRHLVLPVLALMVRPAVQIAQMTAGLLEAELGKRYIRTARSVGYRWSVIRRRHAMRNILAPVVLVIAASARLLMGELILVEWLFKWPGLGNLFAATLVPSRFNVGGSTLFMNPPTVATVLTAFAAFFLIIDFVAAILIRVSDPRVSAAEDGSATSDVIAAQSGVRRRNWSLLLGGIIVLLIIAVAILGPAMAPQDPLEEHGVVQTEDGWETAPFPILTVPGFPLGSDERGRDLLSWLLWAVRPTMIMVTVVALVRLVLGTLIGMTSGWSTGWAGRFLDGIIAGALAVPILMVALAAIAAVGLEVGVIAFVVGLSVTGWAETARLVREQTRLVRGQQYVEAAQALGLSDRRILFRHVLRQIMPMVWMLLALEIAATLMATAGLGFLGYYIGGDVWVEVEDFVTKAMSGMPELGQMLATSNTGLTAISIKALPWGMVLVGTTIFVIVLGFNLLGEGLRRQLSLEKGHRQTLLSRASERFARWYEDDLLFNWRRLLPRVAIAAVVALVVGGGVVWWRARATKQAAAPTTDLAIPGGHLWAGQRHDPYGTRAVEVPGPAHPQILWTFADESGFSGGPAVAADGTIYAASRQGRLYALAPDGQLLWQVELASGAVGTPALNADGDILVADSKAGLSAFSPSGALRWRFQSEAGGLATGSPTIAPDGTAYYAVGSVMQAVTPDGTSLWATRASSLHRITAPGLSPTESRLFWQEVILAAQEGVLVDLGLPDEVDEFITGADGRTYLRIGHNVMQWQETAAGVEIVETTRWDFRALGTVTTPSHAGVTRERVVWIFYTNPYEGSRVAWLEPGGRVLGATRLPFGRSQFIAIDPESTVYLCGSRNPRQSPDPECVALSPDADEPLWQVPLENGERVLGAALVPGRLYVTTNLLTMKEGTLCALGDETP